MSSMQRLNFSAALMTCLYGAWRGWPLENSLERALLAFVIVFAAQILVIAGLLRLSSQGKGRPESTRK